MNGYFYIKKQARSNGMTKGKRKKDNETKKDEKRE